MGSIQEFLTSRLFLLLGGFLGLVLAALLGRQRSDYVTPLRAFLLGELFLSLFGVLGMGLNPSIVFPLTGFVMVITWFCFHYWDWNWIVRNCFATKSNRAFKELISDLNHAIKVLTDVLSADPLMPTSMIIETDDRVRIRNLIQQLEFMDIVPSSVGPYTYISFSRSTPESMQIWRSHFSKALHYAKNENYKKFVQFLRPQEEEAKNAKGNNDTE